MPKISIEVKNVYKSFRLSSNSNDITSGKDNSFKNSKLVVLDDVSFSIKQGEVIAIIGSNGSGKSTLLKLIGGIYSPEKGKIVTNGKIAPLLQIGTGFQNELKADDNIISYGMLLGFTKSEIKKRIPSILKFAELENFSQMKLKNYSSGMRVRLAFSIAIQIDPDILLVDEILSVGDTKFRKKSFESFLKFKSEQRTIVFTSHNMTIVKQIADRVILINHSKIISIGEPNSVIQKYEQIS